MAASVHKTSGREMPICESTNAATTNCGVLRSRKYVLLVVNGHPGPTCQHCCSLDPWMLWGRSHITLSDDNNSEFKNTHAQRPHQTIATGLLIGYNVTTKMLLTSAHKEMLRLPAARVSFLKSNMLT